MYITQEVQSFLHSPETQTFFQFRSYGVDREAGRKCEKCSGGQRKVQHCNQQPPHKVIFTAAPASVPQTARRLKNKYSRLQQQNLSEAIVPLNNTKPTVGYWYTIDNQFVTKKACQLLYPLKKPAACFKVKHESVNVMYLFKQLHWIQP